MSVATRAAAVAPSKSPLDVLEGALLEADAAGKLTVTATNMEVALEQRLPCTSQDNDALAVRAGLLAKMLGLLGGDTVELSRQPGDSRVLIRSGTTSYHVQVWERNGFPKPEIPFPEDTVLVRGIPSMAQRTVFATVRDEQKPLLRCVNLMFRKDGLRAAGSNGGCVITARGDDKSTGDISLLLPADSLDRLARMCSDEDEFRVGTTGRKIVFFKDDFLYSALLAEGDYIDTDRLMGGLRSRFSVLTDIAGLRKALRAAMSVGSDGKVLLKFEGSRLTVRCLGTCGEAEEVLDVAPLTGTPSGKYWYLAKQLHECLRALSGTVTLGVTAEGILLLNTEKDCYMQTAVRAPVLKEKAKPPRKRAA